MNRVAIFVSGIAATLAATAIWYGPLGAGERFATSVEHGTRAQLNFDEMTQVTARLQRGPLTRRLILSGPADDFQRGEIVRRMEALPGVGEAVWDPGITTQRGAPMIPVFAEVTLMALACFTLGIFLAYLVALRRRMTRR